MTLNENILKICENLGVTLYDTELVKENGVDIFRVYITKEGGVNLETCEKISKLISPILDLMPPTSGKYFFEVSSPGIERKLKKLRHFQLSIGDNVVVVIKNKENGENGVEKIEGVLKSVDGETIFVETDSGVKSFDFNDIKKAKTIFKW